MRRSSLHSARTRGFSLVELLVAMAILTTVIGGVVALYLGAIRTYRVAAQATDLREIGNATLDSISRDLTTAFTARDYGELYQFHGTPFGMMFVGAGADGTLSRVTYVVNRLNDDNDFLTEFTIPLRLLLDRAVVQGAEWAIDDGITSSNCINNNPYTDIQFGNGLPVLQTPLCDGVMFARRLVEALLADGAIKKDPDLVLEAYDEAVRQGLQEIRDGFVSSFEYGNLVDQNRIVDLNNDSVTVDATVLTTYLLRYEELGITDTARLELPPQPLNPAQRMRFPKFNAESVEDTRFNEPDFGDYNCVFTNGSIEQNSSTGQDLLQCLLYSSILAPDEFDLFDADLRALYTGQANYGGLRPARFVNADTVNAIVEARQRTVWLSMLAGADPLGIIDPQINFVPLLFSDGSPNPPRNWFEAFRLNDTTPNTARTDDNKNPEDYVIAEKLVSDVRLNLPDLGDPVFINNLQRFDALGFEDFFVYADTDEEYEATYNTADDIPGYEEFRLAGTGADPVSRIVTFDTLLGEEFRGIRTDASTGSPITPAIPKLVSPRFWIMAPEPVVGAPEFRQYFDRVIELPAGATRSLPPQFVANSS